MQNFTIPETQKRQNGKKEDYKSQPLVLQKPQNTEEVFDHNHTAAFPPFEVLLTWLTYTYRQTGEWPVPPEELQSYQSNKTQSVAQIRPYNIEERQTEQDRQTKIGGVTEIAENKRLWIVSDAKAVQEVKSKGIIQKYSTAFDYVNSCYFGEAARLIESHANQPIQDELLFGCQHVLSLIIAWCHFPLFKDVGKRQGRWMILGTAHCARELKMRVASFRECVQQLETAGVIVTGQAGSNTIERSAFEQLRYDCSTVSKVFGAEASKYWSRQSVQAKTIVYRVVEKIELDTALPPFNPFASGTYLIANLSDSRERPNTPHLAESISGKDFTEDGKDLEAQASSKSLVSRSFPGVPCYDKLTHDADDSNNIFLKETSITGNSRDAYTSTLDISGTADVCNSQTRLSNTEPAFLKRLAPEQRAKFDFLNNQATFEGYCRKDGRATLDTQEVLKFAFMENLSLEELQLRYDQAKEMWATGQCKKNPIGLLHWAIVNNCDPRGYDDHNNPSSNIRDKHHEPKEIAISSNPETAYSSTNNRNGQSVNVPFGSRNHYSGRSGYRSNSAYNAIQRRSGNKIGRDFPVTPKLDTFSRVFTGSEGVADELNSTAFPDISGQASDVPKDLVALWKEIMDYDLAGRFRLSNKELHSLVGSQLEFITNNAASSGEKQIRIVLRSIIEENQLGLATRSTIQIAIRQKLGPGYTLLFTSIR